MANDTDDWFDVPPPSAGREAASDDVTGSVSDGEKWTDVPTQAASQGSEWVDVAPGGEPIGAEPSQAASAAAGVATGAAPAIGGLAAGLYAGGAATAAAAPLGPIAAPVIGIGAGLLTGLGAGSLIGAGQEKLLEWMGLDKGVKRLRDANPTTFDLAQMAPAAALLRPNLKSADLLARGIGAGIGGAAEAGMEAIHGDGFDATKIGAAVGMGAAFPRANRFGDKVIAAGENVPGRYRGGNKNPDLKATEEEIPAPQQEDIELANDVTTTAGGVAAENPKAPEIPGVGNPGQAAGAAHEAARPSEPERNYAKDQAATHPEINETKLLDNPPVTEEVKAALDGEVAEAPPREQVQQPARADVTQPEAAPTINPGIYENLNEKPLPRRGKRAKPAADDEMVGERDFSEGDPSKLGETDAVPGPEPVPEAKAPSPLTAAEQASLKEDRAILKQHGWDRALAALDSVSEREQLAAIRTGANEIRKQEAVAAGAKASEGEARRPDGKVRKESRAKLDTGALAPSKKEGARRQAAIDHVKSIYKEFGPGSEAGKSIDPLDSAKLKDTKAYTKRVWEEAKSRNGGVDPLLRSKSQFVPLNKGDHVDAYQWLRALKASATRQEHKNFSTLHSVEGMGKVDEQTGRVEGDIAHRPQLPDAGAEAETATGAMEHSRSAFEHMNPDPRPGADNSYVEAHNKLVDWVNERSPREYEKLADSWDLRAEMDQPGDPASLMGEMKQTLVDTGRRPKGEVTTEVELKPKPVDMPTLPTPKIAADPGKSLKGTDEFKRLAAMYEQKEPKGRPIKTKAEQLEDIKAKEQAEAKAGHTTDAEAIDGTSESAVLNKIKSFIGDEEGALHLPRMFGNPANPATPAAAPGAIDYVTSLDKTLRSRAAVEKNRKIELMGHLAREVDSKLTRGEQRDIAIAEQDNRIGALPQKLQDHYAEHVVPLRNRAMQIMRDAKDLSDAEGLGIDLPNLNAVTTKAYQPRFDISEQSFNRKATDAFDPFTGRGMGDFAANFEDRKFFTLENGTDRHVIEIKQTDAGPEVSIHRGLNHVSKLKNLPASFEGKLGDVVSRTVNGRKGDWTVDQATTKEITAATGGKVQYYENATWQWAKMLDNVSAAYENMKTVTAIKNDPRFKDLTTTDLEVAKEKGWSKATTHLPQFATQSGKPGGKPLYMPDNMRWLFDDYNKPGFGGITSEGIEKLRNFNIGLLKVFNTNAPLVHVLNEADLFVVGRGLKWLSPTGYYNLAKSVPTAIKSVNAQDHLQQEMITAGVNPMLASVGIRGMWENTAKSLGMEVIKNHSKYDPLARAFGVSTKQIGQKLYDLSSDVTWRLSDYLTTMRYLEERAGGDFGAKAKTPEDAATAVNKWMSDYHVGTTVLGSRALQQLITEPAVTAFGRYKYGTFRSIGKIGRDLVSRDATPRERLDAVAQIMILGGLGYIAYPAMDAVVRKVTGEEDAEMRRRGVSSIVEAGAKIATGDKDAAAMAVRTWTPAPVLSAAMDVAKNESFGAKKIIPQGEWPGVIPDAAANVAEYGLKTVIPPYGTMSQHYARPEGSFGGAMGALAADQFGVGLPSDAAVKRQGRIERINAVAERARQRRPSGIIPDLMNRLTD